MRKIRKLVMIAVAGSLLATAVPMQPAAVAGGGGGGGGTSFLLHAGPFTIERGNFKYKVSLSGDKYGTSYGGLWIDVARSKKTTTTSSSQTHSWGFSTGASLLKTKAFPEKTVVNSGTSMGTFGKVNMRFKSTDTSKSCGGKITVSTGVLSAKFKGGAFRLKTGNGHFKTISKLKMPATIIKNAGCSTEYVESCPGNMFGQFGMRVMGDFRIFAASRKGTKGHQFFLEQFSDGAAYIGKVVEATVPATHVHLESDLSAGSVTAAPGTFLKGSGTFTKTPSTELYVAQYGCGKQGKTYTYTSQGGSWVGDLTGTWDGGYTGGTVGDTDFGELWKTVMN